MFFIAYSFKGQVHVFAGRKMYDENCKSPVLEDKCNIKIFLSPDILDIRASVYAYKTVYAYTISLSWPRTNDEYLAFS